VLLLLTKFPNQPARRRTSSLKGLGNLVVILCDCFAAWVSTSVCPSDLADLLLAVLQREAQQLF
jgi:hypothetical protein